MKLGTMKTNYILIFSTFLILGFSQCKSSSKVVSSNSKEDPVFFADEGCPDLILEDLKVVETKKSDVYISYKITNKGDAPMTLLGQDSKKKKDNTAIKLYFSSNETFEVGDVLVGGLYVDNKALADKGGKLEAGASYEGVAKVSIKRKTSFTPYLVMDVDAWQLTIECDETNNQASIKLD